MLDLRANAFAFITLIPLCANAARPDHPLQFAGDEGIGPPFMADGRSRTVAADEADIVAERQQLFGDRPDQGLVIAAGQIGAADRAVEQDIADMGEAHLLVEEHDAAWRVSGTVQYVESQFADRDLVALIEPAIGGEIPHAGDAKS